MQSSLPIFKLTFKLSVAVILQEQSGVMDDFDKLLNNMESQMNSTSAYQEVRRPCFRCKRDMAVGQVLLIFGREWHPECFRCCKCNTTLPYSTYKDPNATSPILSYGTGRRAIALEGAGDAYCESCFAQYFNNRCEFCLKEMSPNERDVRCLGKIYHPEHFNCTKCSRHIGDTGKYFVRSNKHVCEGCAK
eukprot:TRINITY_DN2202_c0_g1_i2.p1 TRINITY_DN2202_c0_g1~~TRINITY_DN2202_c0_g1_i2.p1  ORF type:complete len:190 (+),score=25.53 TRINITY_DN2202_c0_g1_i2:54-623(+)